MFPKHSGHILGPFRHFGPGGPERPLQEATSPKTGCPRGGLRECAKSVGECPRSVKKLFRTLQGHSQGTFWTVRNPILLNLNQAAGHPMVPRTPDTLGNTHGTFWARETPVAGGKARNLSSECPTFLNMSCKGRKSMSPKTIPDESHPSRCSI